MARYIDADKIDYTVTMVGRDEYAGYRAVAFESDIDEIPTADVVPKSEVDKTIAGWAYLHADVLNKLENARAEVAREIFEEIETCMKDFEDDDDGYLLKKCEFEFFMREIKKEYT